MYHVLARGDRRELIVLGDDDRWMFLRTLGEMAKRTGIRVHAYALMDNHYHLVLENSEGESGCGHAVVSDHLHPALQRQEPEMGPSVRRALQPSVSETDCPEGLPEG